MSTISASTTSTTAYKVTADTTGTLVLQTGSTPTTAVTIDGSQNVTLARGISNGLNVSGAGWGVLPYISNSLVVDNNSGQARFFATGDASNFGSYIWYGGKTGGSTSTYMVLDTSGRLGIGISSLSAKLNVQVGAVTTLGEQASSGLFISGGGSTNNLCQIALGYGTTYAPVAISSITTTQTGNTIADLVFATRSANTDTAPSERARITSGGGLWVGTTTRQSTSNSAFIQTTVNDWTANFQCNTSTSSQNLGVLIYYAGSAPNNTSAQFLLCQDPGGTRAEIRSNGGLANYSANNANLSDVRTKTDIQDAGSYLSKICAIPVRTFKYKDQTDDLLNLGVIAQEVEVVAPELVDVSGFGETPEDGVPLKAIYQTDLQYALMKCIQEQQAIIETLTNRITALEAK